MCINASKEEITKLYGAEYSKVRQYHTSAKGAQEAHEAIRPTYMENATIEGTSQEKKLYELIWKRTIASQMADAEIEKTTVNITISGAEEFFVAQGEVVKFDGFIKVYRESVDDEEQEEESHVLPPLKKGLELTRREIQATERFSQGPLRYTEASLVHKLEELGIGRPSTYAPTISTIQQREYVHKGDKKGEERFYTIDTLKGKVVTQKKRKEMAGSDKGKLLPTDIGIVVNDFLMKFFPTIMDYNFTAKVEQDFDKIAEGDEKWTDMMKSFYKKFEPTVEKTMNAQKPRFAQMPSEKSIESITLEEAMELFQLPRTLGDFEGSPVVIGTGRFGPYVLHQKKYTSLPKDVDPMDITLEDAVALVKEKRQQESQKHLKSFDADGKMQILNGRYGPYIAFDGKNYRIPKALHPTASKLTFDQCMEIIEKQKK